MIVGCDAANRWTGICLGYWLLVLCYQEEASLSPVEDSLWRAVADLTRPALVHHSETRLWFAARQQNCSR
jgi:hypothetical protein